MHVFNCFIIKDYKSFSDINHKSRWSCSLGMPTSINLKTLSIGLNKTIRIEMLCKLTFNSLICQEESFKILQSNKLFFPGSSDF
ncbi:hypothetical protein BpHYR1_039692 [Brachionus plicatilis]|uniref:Uncharacterized protein n=1 Tax=Brachionus plicatilis TaxID=10195 RepID=A0A3M7QDF8_BRAPC|nr:hypothetical protein BpHYR1_039692 [Brachionus plicatilis]